ncbi:MAG: ATP-binding protein, partial [Cetobacterium sp.]
IITTNLDYNEDKPCEITQKFSIDGKDRIKDRIKDMCFPMKCVGESKRKINKDEFLEEILS